MNVILITLFEISITSAILIVALLLLRKLFRSRVRSLLIYSLWLLVALRLMMPFSIPSSSSILNSFEYKQAEQFALQAESLIASNLTEQRLAEYLDSQTVENFAPSDDSLQSLTAQSAATDRNATPAFINRVLLFVWLIGMVITSVYMIILNVRYRRNVSKNLSVFPREKQSLFLALCRDLRIHKNIDVFISDAIPSPCLMGLFHPRIIVTRKVLKNDRLLHHVLLHELCHYQHRDHWFVLLRNICVAIYWFNPLVWLAASASRDDAELACDETVLQHLNHNEATEYGYTLLQLISLNPIRTSIVNASTTMTSGGKKMNKRINQIVHPTKATKLAMIAIVAILLIVCSITLFGASKNKENLSINEPISEQYVDLEELSAYETRYVGNASKVGGILASLPSPSSFHLQNRMSLQTTTEPFGLTVYYEPNDNQFEIIPFWHSKMDNNALLLFTYIDNLGEITFAYRDTPSQGDLNPKEYSSTYDYFRDDFIQKYGDLIALRENPELLQSILLENLQIDPFRVHENRISFASTREDVIYRNGEPESTLQNDNGSYQHQYKNLGAIEAHSPDGNLIETIPGSDVCFYLNGYGVEGVYAAIIEGDSYILFNLGIESDLTYEGITKKLGKPQLSLASNSVISYRLFNFDERYVTFAFAPDGGLIAHGFYTGTNPLENR